jgi:hypothetical protein
MVLLLLPLLLLLLCDHTTREVALAPVDVLAICCWPHAFPSPPHHTPVMSPSSEDAWKMLGFSNTKMAVPAVPLRLRFRATSGTVGSSTPLMNWIFAASQTCCCRWKTRCTRLLGAALTNGRTPGGVVRGGREGRQQQGNHMW